MALKWDSRIELLMYIRRVGIASLLGEMASWQSMDCSIITNKQKITGSAWDKAQVEGKTRGESANTTHLF